MAFYFQVIQILVCSEPHLGIEHKVHVYSQSLTFVLFLAKPTRSTHAKPVFNENKATNCTVIDNIQKAVFLYACLFFSQKPVI